MSLNPKETLRMCNVTDQAADKATVTHSQLVLIVYLPCTNTSIFFEHPGVEQSICKNPKYRTRTSSIYARQARWEEGKGEKVLHCKTEMETEIPNS